MSVFRVEKNKGYTVMSNHHLRNHTLSLKAKGLLSQMLSLPDDWDYTLQALAQINKESIDAIREAVRELERAGYIKRSRERDERGCLRGTVYTIYEQPHAEPTPEKPMQALPTLDNPILEKPMLDKPTLENPMQLITKGRNKEKQNTDQSITDSIPFPSGFPESPTQKRTETKGTFESYRELIDTMAGRPVTIRTIDVGGDKLLSAEARKRNYFSSAEKEDNPALGLRAIRFTLANPNLFITQIRAILRAASGADVRIMLPMISSLQEIREAKRYIELAKTQLREEKLEFNEFVPVGIMIELPAAVICAEELLAEADFASLGTNDLIQYTLGVDRGNPSVAPLYDECHPAVLRLIRAAVKAAQKQNKPISICGEMGGRREMVPFFLGLGINELSMVPMQIPIVKEMIRSLKRSSCQRLTLKLVKSRDSGEVRKLLEQFTEKGVEENVG